MLLRFRFSNFQSFRTEQEFSLVASLGSDSDGELLPIPALKERGLRCAAMYGANASGKTTVLRALQFMAAAVRNSHRLWEPGRPVAVRPFRGGPEAPALPSEFEVDFEIDGVRLQYGFSLDVNGVVAELLSAFPNGKKQTWFRRQRGKPITFGRNLPGDNKTIAGLTRNNSLFVSAAAQNNHEALSPVYEWFGNGLSFVIGDRLHLTSETARLCTNDEYRSAIAELVSGADFGITDLKLEVSDHDEARREKTKKLIEAMASVLELKSISTADLDHPTPSFKLLHRFGESMVAFDLDEESNGTIAYLAILGPVMTALKSGGALFIDELDSSLHPLIAREVVNLFKNTATNPRGAQLVFNTHDASLLGGSLLRRDQVWFIEKDRNGECHLYPLTDFKPRKEENLGSGYLQGRYGAIPFIHSVSFTGDWERDAEIR